MHRLIEKKINYINQKFTTKLKCIIEKCEDNIYCDVNKFYKNKTSYCTFTFILENSFTNFKQEIETSDIEMIGIILKLIENICAIIEWKININSIIKRYCSQIINNHKENIKRYQDYLTRWNINKNISIYKDFNDAYEALQKYSKNLEKEVKTYLTHYYPTKVNNIINLNKKINITNKINKDIIEKYNIIIEIDFNILNENTLYNLHFN